MSEASGRPRILLATDLSRWAQRAEVYACSLASSWGATLTVISVLEFPPGMNPDYAVNRLYLGELMKQATKQLVDLKARAVNRGLSVHTRITTGIPSEEVLAAAEAEDTDLIVVGTRGKTGLQHVLLGSTAERIIRTAPCPVLAVPTEIQKVEESGGTTNRPVVPDRILVPIDFSDCSLDALEYGVLVAQRAKAAIKLFHVLEPVSYGLDFTLLHVTKREQMRTVITERLSALVSALTSAEVTSEFLISGGLPADSILDAARAQPADMIIMGTHGRRGLSHTFCGSVAESVLRKSPCPVLMVRSPKFHATHRRVTSVANTPPPMNP
ncbi:MAG: universal stress protein [Nitrospirae bacterium]|nr:universal stress protein [Nitrospirota bacterium]